MLLKMPRHAFSRRRRRLNLFLPLFRKKKKNSLSLSKYHKQLPRPSICRAFLPRQKLDSSEEDPEPIEASLLALSARAASLDETLRLLSLRARAARGAREAQRGAASTLVRACEAARGEWRAEAQRVAEHEAFAARDRAAEAEAEALRCALAAASVAAAVAAAALTAADARADGLRRQLAEFELGEDEDEEEEEEDVSAAVGATFRALAEAVEASSRESGGEGGSVAVAKGGGGGGGGGGEGGASDGGDSASKSSSSLSPHFLSPSLPGGRGVLASAALSANVPLGDGEEEGVEAEDPASSAPSLLLQERESRPPSPRSPTSPLKQKHPGPPPPSIFRRAGLTGVALAAALRGALAAYRVAREVAGPRGSRARAAVDVAAASAVASAALWLAAI